MIARNFDNQFFRMVTIALTKTLTRQIRWINRFTPDDNYPTGKMRVLIPFYAPLVGDERFIFDAFVDDIVDKRVGMNTDQLQRGVVTLTSFGSRSEEFANPNIYLSKNCVINDELRRVVAKVKAVPMTMNYDIEIQLSTENEVGLCSAKIMDLLFNYYFFNFDYYGLKIDAVLTLPDDKTVEIPRSIEDLTGDRKKKIKFALTIRTYYPIFRITTDDLEICDNDDEINWENMDIPRPTEDFINSLKAYNAAYNQMGYRGGTITGVTFDDGTSGSTTEMYMPEGLTEIRRVYWKAYFQTYQNFLYKKPYDYPQDLENFNVFPTEPEEPNL